MNFSVLHSAKLRVRNGNTNLGAVRRRPLSPKIGDKMVFKKKPEQTEMPAGPQSFRLQDVSPEYNAAQEKLGILQNELTHDSRARQDARDLPQQTLY